MSAAGELAVGHRAWAGPPDGGGATPRKLTRYEHQGGRQTGHRWPFRVGGRLGSGGMGTVWRARDSALHREVALKEVRPATGDAEQTPRRARCCASAYCARRGRWPGSTTRTWSPSTTSSTSGDGPTRGSSWSWSAAVRCTTGWPRGPMPPAEAAAARPRCAGRAPGRPRRRHPAPGRQARQRPAPPGRAPVLTDFGIAAIRESTSLTATGDLIGSPEYIAPERIRGEEGNPASDLWSLGMLLYVALEGGHPLRRATSMSTLVAVLDDPIPAPVRSGALTPVLNALLVRDAAARPDAAQVERMLADAGSDALRRPPAPRPPRRPYRRPRRRCSRCSPARTGRTAPTARLPRTSAGPASALRCPSAPFPMRLADRRGNRGRGRRSR